MLDLLLLPSIADYTPRNVIVELISHAVESRCNCSYMPTASLTESKPKASFDQLNINSRASPCVKLHVMQTSDL